MAAARDQFAYERVEHEASVAEWRRARLARLTAPDGWLSLVGRFQLKAGLNRAGSAEDVAVVLEAGKAPSFVGTFQLEGTAVTFTPAAGLELSLRGSGGEVRPLSSGVAQPLRSDREGTADRVMLGSLTMEVMERESGVFVRVRDPESATRREFGGFECFPTDPKWRVVARLERYEPHKVVELDYDAGATQRYESPGAAVFEVDGVTCRLDPVFETSSNRLYLVFRDETARDSTYGAGRFLYAPLPEGDRVLLDFNQAFSPPCAFTPYAACPIAPAQNRLLIRVEAGEKRPPL